MNRGRYARRPSEMDKTAWKDIAYRIKEEISDDNIFIVAAGAAFYAFLALIPGLTALVSIYGLVADPADVSFHMKTLGGIVPDEMQLLIEDQLKRIVDSSSTALGIGTVIAILISLWSASSGMKGLVKAVNIAYDEKDRRNFIKLSLLALEMALCAIVFFLLLFTAIIVIPRWIENLGAPGAVEFLLHLLLWGLLAVMVSLALALIYRYAPYRTNAQWRWITYGSVIATILWLIASFLFSLYTRNFGDYNATYGSLGAVVVLMLWLWISNVVILLGAEINSEIEHQTTIDSTTGPERPMGERGAYMADNIGKARNKED